MRQVLMQDNNYLFSEIRCSCHILSEINVDPEIIQSAVCSVNKNIIELNQLSFLVHHSRPISTNISGRQIYQYKGP